MTTEDEVREIYRVAGCWEAMGLIREWPAPAPKREDVKRVTRWARPRK